MFLVNLFCFFSLKDVKQLQDQDQPINFPIFSMAPNTVLNECGRKPLTVSTSNGCILRKKRFMCGSDKAWGISGEDAPWVRISYVYHLNPQQQAKITVTACGQKFMKIIAWQIRVKVSFFQNMWRGRKRVHQVFCVPGCLGKIILPARSEHCALHIGLFFQQLFSAHKNEHHWLSTSFRKSPGLQTKTKGILYLYKAVLRKAQGPEPRFVFIYKSPYIIPRRKRSRGWQLS